jgi:hypothetical protein
MLSRAPNPILSEAELEVSAAMTRLVLANPRVVRSQWLTFSCRIRVGDNGAVEVTDHELKPGRNPTIEA